MAKRNLVLVRVAFLSCVAVPGTSTRGGHARRSAAGIRGLSVTGTTVFGSPGSCNAFLFFLFPFLHKPFNTDNNYKDCILASVGWVERERNPPFWRIGGFPLRSYPPYKKNWLEPMNSAWINPFISCAFVPRSQTPFGNVFTQRSALQDTDPLAGRGLQLGC
jgi:hypothetical protein